MYVVANEGHDAIFTGLFDSDRGVAGTWKYGNGERYEGQVNAAGEKDGTGTLFYANGGGWKGTWKKDTRLDLHETIPAPATPAPALIPAPTESVPLSKSPSLATAGEDRSSSPRPTVAWSRV